MSDRRGRRHSRNDDRYDDRYDHHDNGYEDRPRNRSLGRKALDKLESAIGALNLDGDGRPSRSSSHRHHSRDRYYPPSSSTSHHHHRHHPHRSHQTHPHDHRRYHSASPTRRARSRGPASRRSSSSSHHRHHRSPSRSRSRWERGIEAAVDAAAIEAVRLRREPGPWAGPKGQRIATAALSAGVLGAAAEKHKQDHSRRRGGGAGKFSTLGSAVGGLVVNRLVNGPREEVRRRDS